jgi:Transposase DDE domain
VGLCVAGANRNDFKLFANTILSIPVERPEPSAQWPQHLCLDKGDDFEEVRGRAAAFGFVAHIRSRGEEAHARETKPDQKARRWVVERTHAWMNRFRSLLIRWAKKPENYLGMLHFVCGLIAYRAAGLFGWAVKGYRTGLRRAHAPWVGVLITWPLACWPQRAEPAWSNGKSAVFGLKTADLNGGFRPVAVSTRTPGFNLVEPVFAPEGRLIFGSLRWPAARCPIAQSRRHCSLAPELLLVTKPSKHLPPSLSIVPE